MGAIHSICFDLRVTETEMSSNRVQTDPNLSQDYDNFETPQEVYKRLIELINNQISSPEVLPYEESVIECVVEQIQHMSDNMKRLSDKLDQFCIEQHTTELERFSYVCHHYLRTRLHKIEANANTLIKSLQTNRKSIEKLLSKNEIKYLDNYISGIDSYLNQSVLNRLSLSRTSIMSFKSIDVPNSDTNHLDNTYVFVKAIKETQVLIDDSSGQQTIHLERDSQHFLPYNAIRRHLMTGSRDIVLI